jgi:hypothetical protein
MTTEQAAREYDIDYRATMGAKVFPEITQRRVEIVVPNFVVPEGLRCWGGFDYGTRNPSSFHVYTILDGVTYSIWELYEPCKNVAEFAAKLKACPYWPRLRYIAADPSCWSPTQQQVYGQPISVADLFQQEGIRNFMKGRNDGSAEDAWVALIRAAWAEPEPSFRICENCPNQINEFEMATYVSQTERQLLTSIYAEKINNKDNHSLDDCKYYMLSRPAVQASSPWEYANMASSYGPAARGAGRSRGRKPIGGYA